MYAYSYADGICANYPIKLPFCQALFPDSLLSKLAVARYVPSGLKATPMTELVWPARVSTSRPDAVSHILTILSKLAVARRVPSGLKATPRTVLVWPNRVRTSRPDAASHTLAV